MKGLLMKDCRVLLRQKRLWLLIPVCGIFVISVGNYLWSCCWITVIGAVFALNTFAYDEMDNGYAFLFSLPFDRRDYVWAKYLFVGLSTLLCWLLGLGLCTISAGMSGEAWGDVLESLKESAFAAFVLGCMFSIIEIPAVLKFGQKNAYFVLVMPSVLIVCGTTLAKRLNLALPGQLACLSDPAVFVPLVIFVAAVLFACSIFISVRIVEQKEF